MHHIPNCFTIFLYIQMSGNQSAYKNVHTHGLMVFEILRKEPSVCL